MPSAPESNKRRSDQRTLADYFFYLANPIRRDELERFRVKFEAVHGDTDLTQRWTSMLERDDRQWLIKHYPRRYWNGLPPFVQAFVKSKMDAARVHGTLDDMPDALLRLYLEGDMGVDGITR